MLASEGNEQQTFAHVNKLTAEFGASTCNAVAYCCLACAGIYVNHDSLVRSVYYSGHFHPKARSRGA